MKTRLGKRLTHLLQQIPSNCDRFYDLCCDHGGLGRAVLERLPDCEVVFNDIHPDIMARLQALLMGFGVEHAQLATCPAEELTLANCQHGCIMLAGVGDEQCIKILQALLQQQAAQNYRFIISPATKTHYVRRYLNQAPLTLLSETIVSENKRSYEVISVQLDKQPSQPVSLFGDGWQAGNSDHQQHLKKLISFYQAQLNRQATSECQAIVTGYQKILKNII